MQLFAILVFALVLLGGPSTQAHAQGQCSSPLRVGMSSVPNEKIADTTAIGLLVDELMDELTRKSGAEFKPMPMPRVRAFAELRAGRVEVVPMATRTAERDGHAQLLVMGRLKAALLVRKSAGPLPASREELLAGRTHVLLARGQEFGERAAGLIKELARQGRLEVVGDQLAAVRMLGAGRADAILGLPIFFAPALDAAGLLDAMEVLDLNLADAIDEGFYIGKHVPPACFQRLLQASASLRGSGAYRKLIERHFPPGLQAAFVD